jgi:hypothetical protein
MPPRTTMSKVGCGGEIVPVQAAAQTAAMTIDRMIDESDRMIDESLPDVAACKAIEKA